MVLRYASTLPLAALPGLLLLLLLFLQPVQLKKSCEDQLNGGDAVDYVVANVTCSSTDDNGPNGPCQAPCEDLGDPYKNACCAQIGSYEDGSYSGSNLCVCCRYGCNGACSDPPSPTGDTEEDTNCVIVNSYENDCGGRYIAGGICTVPQGDGGPI